MLAARTQCNRASSWPVSELLEVESADDYCRRLATRHYENFAVVSKFVPGRLRLDLMRIYAYCRTTDDLGDESADPSTALARLERWRDEVNALFAGSAPVHPVLLALRETVTCHNLGSQPFLDLIAANVQDQQVHTYETWQELHAYCLLSAAPVGAMVLGVFGHSDRRLLRLSDDVCIGLQLANHAQDVRRDGERGRIYLLQSDLRRGGTVEAVRGLSNRARELLASGRELESLVPMPLRLQLAMYRLGGLAIVHAMERSGYRTDLHRPRVSKITKAVLLARGFLECMRDDRYARKLEAV